MASSSSSAQQNEKRHAFSGFEPPVERKKASESSSLYDVFINHRGPDVKHTLAIQLYNSLKEFGIRAFLDSEERELGDSFISTIETAIRSAAVHIAIFSKKYAESPWCLAELVLMSESKATVFYDVKPSELRHVEKGTYAHAFTEYENKARYLDKLKEWKEALQSVSFLIGEEFYKSHDCKSSIVSAVRKEVERTKPLYVAEHPVGLDKLVEDFERRCLHHLVEDFENQCNINRGKEKAKMIGIFGMGGVGKTTLSTELFNRKRLHYIRKSFLSGVREKSAEFLQRKLLKDIFNEDLHILEDAKSSLNNHIERSSNFSFLIVVDDIDRVEQFNDLLLKDMLSKFSDSLIIVTTRDVGVLITTGITVGYHLKGMDRKDGRELFCWHAFGQPHPASGYDDLVEDFVDVCRDLPLSLRVLGSHVRNRNKENWRLELKKARNVLHRDIQKILQISFDALESEEQQIFMDIACFFVEESKSIAVRVWEGSGWEYAQHALRTLKERCLVEEKESVFSSYSHGLQSLDRIVFRMHDHLRDLGRAMAKEPSHPRRLWRPKELISLESRGFENILAQIKGCRCFHSFRDKSLGSKVKFFIGESDGGVETTTSFLWLQFENLAQPSIPPWIPLQNLQCLRMSYGHLTTLWQAPAPSQLKELQIYKTDVDDFSDLLEIENNLEEMAIDSEALSSEGSSSFRSLGMNLCTFSMSNFSSISKLKSGEQVALNNAGKSTSVSGLESRILISGNQCPSLESLKLHDMSKLIEVDLKSLTKLNCLEVTNCKNFARLSATSDLTNFAEFKISQCPNLNQLRFGGVSCLKKITIENCLKKTVVISDLGNLVELNIGGCISLQELRFFCLSSLQRITLRNCKMLRSVSGMSDLKKLVRVGISECGELLDLSFSHLSCLEKLSIYNCNKLRSLSGMSDLIKLVELNIGRCSDLQELSFVDLSGLEKITIYNCRKLQRVPGIDHLTKLVDVNIIDCYVLQELSFDPLSYLEKITIEYCKHLKSVSGVFCLTKLVELNISQCVVELELCLAGLECLKRITVDRSVNLSRFELDGCKNLKTVSGMFDPKNLVVLNIRHCPELEELPILRGPSCLERIIIDGCRKLNFLGLYSCQNLKIVSGDFDLAGLSISDCPELGELPCFEQLTSLEMMSLVRCGKLQSINLPTTLNRLNRLQLKGCGELRSIKGLSDIKKLVKLKISECPKLQHCVAHLTCLQNITIENCNHLNSVSEIFGIGKLIELKISEFPELEELSAAHLSCLVKIKDENCEILNRVSGIWDLTKQPELEISEWPELQELSVARLSYLKNITIESCNHLNRVLGICDLTELVELKIYQCWELELDLCLSHLNRLERVAIVKCGKVHNITLPESVIELTVEGCRGLETVAGICNLSELTNLCIRECPELELDSCLSHLNSLKRIAIVECGKVHNITLPTCLIELTLQGLKTVPAGIWNLPKLTNLYIRECPELELDSCLSYLNSLKRIAIVECGKVHNITLPESVIELTLEGCRGLETVAGIYNLSELTNLCIRECPELELVSCLSHLNSLKRIAIVECGKVHNITLPTCLIELTLQGLKTVPAGIWNLPKLTDLYIRECPELELDLCLSHLNSLKRIAIVECGKVHNISLPTCLIELTLQGLKTVPAGIWNLPKLTDLYIRECPELELDSCLSHLNSLKRIAIVECGKVHNITLPTCLIELTLQGLKTVPAGIWNLPNLTDLYSRECPELELDSCLSHLNSRKMIAIVECGKVHNITLPTCLIKLTVQGLKTVPAGIWNLPNLTDLYIRECPELELDSCLSHLKRLKRIAIVECGKVHNITLPTCLIELTLQGLKTVPAGIWNLPNLTDLYIRECPELELDSCLSHLNSLKRIAIVECGKVHNISLPTCLIELTLQGLKTVPEGIWKLPKLTDLYIRECPELELDSCLSHLNSLKRIAIVECGKVHNITLPTCLLELTLQGLKTVPAGIWNLPKLTDLYSRECPELELDLCLSHLNSRKMNFIVDCKNCLSHLNSRKMIAIVECGKVHNITLPTCLIKLTLQGLKTVPAGIWNLPNLTYLCIRECPELELDSCLSHLNSLKRIAIVECGKVHNITLPTCLIELTLQGLKTVPAGIWNLPNLTDLYIRECPELELDSCLSHLNSLKRIAIVECGKVHNITLPTCLIELTLQGLKTVPAGIWNLPNLTDLYIRECPELELDSCLSHLNSLKRIAIVECGKVHNVTLPTCLIELTLQGLKTVPAGIWNLPNLTDLYSRECPELELDSCLSHLNSLKMIAIVECGKVHNITLPTCLIKLTLQGLKTVPAGIWNLPNLTDLYIRECPELELDSCLSHLNSLKRIAIVECGKVHNITLPTCLIELTLQGLKTVPAGIWNRPKLTNLYIRECPELEEFPIPSGPSQIIINKLKHMQILYCNQAAVRNYIHRLQRVPSRFMFAIGRAVDGAESTLNRHFFSDNIYSCHAVTGIHGDRFHLLKDKLLESGAVIACNLVVVDCSPQAEHINKSLSRFHWLKGFELRPGEWIITTVFHGPDERFHCGPKMVKFEEVCMEHGIMKGYWVTVTEDEWNTLEVLDKIVDELYDADE